MAPLAAQSFKQTAMPSPPSGSQRPLQQSEREPHGVPGAKQAPLTAIGKTQPSSGTTVDASE
jgi:hypothetical protein